MSTKRKPGKLRRRWRLRGTLAVATGTGNGSLGAWVHYLTTGRWCAHVQRGTKYIVLSRSTQLAAQLASERWLSTHTPARKARR